MNRLKKILESRTTGIICLLFAITNRVIFASLYSLIGADTKLQLTYAENVIAGKGMGLTKYFTSNLNTPIFDTQQGFPPGFSILIIPFLKLFGGDEYKTVLAFDILVAIFFVIIVRLVGKKAGLPPALNNVVTLMAGCVQYLFFSSWSSTEAVCICLLLFSIVQSIDIINRKEHLTTWKIIGYGLLFYLPFFFRYMYFPVTIFFPLFIFLSGLLLRNSNLKTGGLKILSVTVLFLILQVTSSLLTSGNALYMVDTERGFFIKQLGQSYPFLPASFINIDFAAQLIQNVFGIDYSLVMRWLTIINPVLIVVLLFLFGKYVTANKTKLLHYNNSLFILIGSLACIIILLLLSWLTITYKERIWGFYRWVYVSEARYFSFINIFIPLTLFVCLYHYRSFLRHRLMLFIVVIGLCCLATEVLHGIYYNIKILAGHPSLNYIRDSDKGFRNFPSFLKQIKSQYPDREIIVCSPDNFYLYTSSQLGYKTVFDYTNFLQRGLDVSSKTILVMPIQPQDVAIISDYIEQNKPDLLYSVPSASFYIQKIDPPR